MTALLATLALLIVALNITGSDTAGLSLSDLPGYVQFPDLPHTAYKIHEEPATWNEARERCMAEGGHLAIADSPKKIAHMKSMTNQTDHWLHVGIFKIVDSNQWASFDNGIPIPSVPWAYVNADHVGSCAGISMFVDGLVDYPCNGKQEYFVCEIRITGDNNGTKPSVPGLLPSDQCTPRNHTSTLPDGYVAYPDVGAAYKVVDISVNWKTARKLCYKEGAQLALIDSLTKIDYVRRENKRKLVIHVGIHRFDNDWVNIRDGAVLESLPWVAGYPAGGPNCVKLHHNSGLLYNWHCAKNTQTSAYVCEILIPTA